MRLQSFHAGRAIAGGSRSWWSSAGPLLPIWAIGGGVGFVLVTPVVLPIIDFSGTGLEVLFASPFKAAVNATLFIATFLCGMRAARAALGDIERERRILRGVARKADDHTTRFHGGQAVIFLDGKGDNAMLSLGADDPSDPAESLTGRMIKALWTDSRNLRFDPIPVVVERAVVDFEKSAGPIRFWQNIAVRLGILATFFGLIIALAPVQNVLTSLPADAAPEEIATWFATLRDGIGEVVVGLSLAFGSSIAGLISALLLQFAASTAHERQIRLIEDLQDVASTVQSLFRISQNGTALINDIRSLERVLDDHQAALRIAADRVETTVRNFGGAETAVTTLLEAFTVATHKQARLSEHLNEIEARLGEAARQTIEDTGKSLGDVMWGIQTELATEIRNSHAREARAALGWFMARSTVARPPDEAQPSDAYAREVFRLIVRPWLVDVGFLLLALLAAGGVTWLVTRPFWA